VCPEGGEAVGADRLALQDSPRQGGPVARVVVDVMPKPEILDPQGKAVLGALPRLGFDGVTDVRQGKRFELEIEDGPSEELMDRARRMAEMLLANPVIENFEVRLVEPA
jgi:phosphoribosylformylglycinamidine synthase